jgi:FixJ family two-component response regulator
MTNFEGIYRSADSLKRREEVLERMHAGITEKKIATDLGIAPHSVAEIVASLREDGQITANPAPG